jgi:septum formation protein
MPVEGFLDMTAPETLASAGRFWRSAQPLILASKSQGRQLALRQTGIPFIAMPAEIDERALERGVLAKGGGADAVVSELARAKALAISADNPGSLVLGADQAASCEQRLFGKPGDLTEAAGQLAFLAGRTHRLHSAAALARDGVVLFETVAHADMRVRPLSDAFINAYLAAVGETALTSAGAYQAEGTGVHLFTAISGDHWTILGLPLLPVLEALRREGTLLA